jgi:F-type H+-transporting ATPase subunit alpha
LGRGQRQLILGDRNTGKSYLAQRTIINQKRPNRFFSPEGLGFDRLFCIYCSIGLRRIESIRLTKLLTKLGCLWYTTVYSAHSGQNSVLQYTLAFKGCTLGELFWDSGFNSLVVYDSLSNHAIAHRQNALLLKNLTPGRECYPTNTFYLHARLLERAGQLTKRQGFGSLTTLPIVETLLDNVTSYIPTSIISITDGQIIMNKNLSQRREYPAIDVPQSVSRVGAKAQPTLLAEISTVFGSLLAGYRRYSTRVRQGYTLSTSEIYDYNRCKCAYRLSQQRYGFLFEEQIMLIIAADAGMLCCSHVEKSIEGLLLKLYQKKNR